MSRSLTQKSLNDIDNDKLYNLKEILVDYSNDWGITIEELKKIFTEYEINSFDQITNYLKNNEEKIFERRFDKKVSLDKVIKNRKVDYEYFKKNLEILSNKGLKYIEIIEYISNMKDDSERKVDIEDILEELGIFHYGSIIKGRDIKIIMRKIHNTTRKFIEYHNKINTCDTYHNQNIDSFAIIMAKEGLYPETTLISEDYYSQDNTSFCPSEIRHHNKKEKQLKKI